MFRPAVALLIILRIGRFDGILFFSSLFLEKSDEIVTGSTQMIEEQINELLADIFSTYAPQFDISFNKKIALRLATLSVEDLLENIIGNGYTLAKTALSECGTVLEESDHTIAGVILSGAANMNPAFVLLRVEDNNIYIRATAKEGLIKQHTAEKAIEIFKSAFASLL